MISWSSAESTGSFFAQPGPWTQVRFLTAQASLTLRVDGAQVRPSVPSNVL